MKSRAAVLWGVHQPWSIEEIDVDPPKAGEVLVQWKAAGLCHSDEHLVTGDMVPPPEVLSSLGAASMFPILGGHEGAGVIEEVGPGVTTVKPGDHVAASFIPSCGRCHYCSTGRQTLCDAGAGTLGGGMITDGTHRHFINGQPLPLLAKTGTFAERTCLSENSVIKVEPHLPFECVALVSCGVATGWGSATIRADVRPGDTVVVVGIGGIGINAVQGARVSGARRIIAIDPVAFKRDMAVEFGATLTAASMEEAMEPVRQLTWGRMADKVIMTPGIVDGAMMGPALRLAGKGSTVVVTGASPIMQTDSAINLFELTMWQKEVKGCLFGSLNPRADIPRLLDLYSEGQLKLDELITRRYALDEINDGYQAMRDGTNLRGVIVFD